MSRPVIGIVVWRRGLKTVVGDPEILHAIADHYVLALSGSGATPLLIPNARPADEAPAVLDRLDGIALSGGGDVDPSTYGAPNSRSYDTDPLVDAWEMALLAEARRRRTPTLCICRGVQILNVAHGGTLHEEILAPGTVHEPLAGKSPAEILAAKHAMNLTDGGRLAAIYGTSALEVNTIHHQAIDRLGDGLAVEGKAPDGIVEAVASTDPEWWCLGVQWHPERNGVADAPLFAALTAAARTVR
jgi:putative glutamine amidotransferase